MVLNYIWIGFFAIAFLIAVVQLIMGNTDVFPAIMNSTFDSARTAFDISLGLTGVLSLWMGIMKIGERGGIIDRLARWLSPLMMRLFPEIPAGHPVFGHIFMNFGANMLGLDNAATPLGLKAMEGLQELNERKDTATNAMIMFLVLNTSGLCLIPVGVMVYRAQMGAAQPTDVFIPILIATTITTLAGMVITSLYQRINLFHRVILGTVLGLCLLVSAVIWVGTQVDRDTMNLWSTTVANVMLFTIIMAFILAGMRRKVNVYEAFVEGAKDGFTTAVRIIPYLVAMLVAIGVFRASGAMDFIIGGIGRAVEACGGNSDYVAALPTAIMRPLSGSGARGLMVDAMQTYGPDSFIGRLSCIFQGSTDTTFYILAVYFGSVGVRRTRYAATAGLLTDVCGVIAALVVGYIFFG
ncbi:MAG: nucleoside recognition domain-containing protein [Bacteroidaceae bacterium]